MNKTEPVREARELGDFGSSERGVFGTTELTNFGSVSPNESFAAAVRNFQTPVLTDSPSLELPTSGTSELREGASS